MTPARYATPQRLLHWLIAALVILALALIEIKGWLPKGSPERAAVKLAHAQFGLAVLLLSLVRVAARWRSTVPPISPPPPRWQMLAAHLMHIALYLLTLLVPLLGAFMMFYAGKPWGFLGLSLPVAGTPDASLAHAIESAHETAGNVLLWLVVAHAVAALYHHVVQRDDTLLRMTKGGRPHAD
ncbi:Cytochrome b561 [Dyella jiangningensis]|uniref:cytochrome b n=1 Tax=Dyella sp. AtDHG13 TaxID=1938897 RepID=UPI0008893872|nr:cytochrome b [Dyella sp. AtDHG13]PXV57406.1 cytochrome b561 [Dyella sp. AtDHG13]SDK43562.1 Cytochrome b561 [Dyella jiangningensis]